MLTPSDIENKAFKKSKMKGYDIQDVEDFLEEFQDKVDIIINDGKSPIGVSSTIVQVKDNKIKIIREGNLKVE